MPVTGTPVEAVSSVNAFGLTVASVRAHMFPHWGDFSNNSNPTTTTVGEIITEEAGDLASRLYREAVAASSITDSTSAPYLWCAKTLRLMVALRILRASTQQEPELNRAWVDELKLRLELLAADGATALGDASLQTGASDPDGPTSHISVYGLTTDDADDMSTTAPRLRRDDAL